MVDAFEDLDQCGALESLENKEVLRELIQQLVGQMRRVLGESLLDRLEAAGLEPAPPGVREYEAESRDDEEEEDEEDDDDNDAA